MSKEFDLIPLGVTNCYLVRCSEGFLLIDTCYYDTYPKFLRILERKHINVNSIRYLLLTHHHDDHAGFAAKLVEDTGCRLIAHEKAKKPLENGETEDTMKPLNHRVWLAFSLFRAVRRKFGYPSVVLTDKDIIITGDNDGLLKELGIDGEILETPGHCSDSISVLLKDGSLFAGDMAMNFLKPCGLKYRPIYNESLEAVYQSWEKVKAKGAKIVYPAHGAPFSIRCLFKPSSKRAVK